MTRVANVMSEKPSPLKFAEIPVYVPGSLASRLSFEFHARHRVDLAAELGMKKESITELDVSRKRTGVSTGKASSFTLAMFKAG